MPHLSGTHSKSYPHTIDIQGGINDMGEHMATGTRVITGGDTWVEESIADSTLVAVMDGLYIRELFPKVCLATFVLECSNGQGRIFGAFVEAS
jgi:hypothetical protein